MLDNLDIAHKIHNVMNHLGRAREDAIENEISGAQAHCEIARAQLNAVCNALRNGSSE